MDTLDGSANEPAAEIAQLLETVFAGEGRPNMTLPLRAALLGEVSCLLLVSESRRGS
jgi:hypothetical protein